MTQKRKILVRFERRVLEWILPGLGLLLFHCFTDYSASIGSEEESGKDWDELEEEARKGRDPVCGGAAVGGRQLAWS